MASTSSVHSNPLWCWFQKINPTVLIPQIMLFWKENLTAQILQQPQESDELDEREYCLPSPCTSEPPGFLS